MVVSKIVNSCVGEAVVVTIVAVSVNCKQGHKSSENNKEFNWKQTNVCFYFVCN